MDIFLNKISICNAIVTKIWKIMGNYILHMAVKKKFKISKKKFPALFQMQRLVSKFTKVHAKKTFGSLWK